MTTAALSSDDPRRAATEAFMATSRLLTGVVARTLRAVDETISVSQLRVLVMLRYAGPMNLNAIADGLGVNASNASRTCDKLVAAGLVDRAEGSDDRRHVSLSLTRRGRRVVDSLMTEREKILDEIVGALSMTRQRHIASGLQAFLDAADAAGLDSSAGGEDSIIPWLR